MPRIPGLRRMVRLPWRDERQVMQDVDEELAFHLEMRERELEEQGMAPGDARQRASHEFGDLERTRRDLSRRGQRQEKVARWSLLSGELAQDVRYAWRQMRQSPGFALVATVTIALGIGGTTAIYGVVDAALLRPLPFREPQALVRVWGTNAENGNLRAPLSWPNHADLRRESRAFTGLAVFDRDARTLTGGDAPERLEGARVSEDFFPVLGIGAARGRLPSSDEYGVRAARVVVISDRLWRRRFGARPDIAGQTLALDEVPHTIVGVLPPARFQLPSSDAEFWVPLAADDSRGSRYLDGFARLRPGATRAQAESELATIAGRLARQYPDANAGIGVRLEPLAESIVGDTRPLLLILLAAAAAVLLIACANTANLLLARATVRRREIAVRTALGAGRGRLARQLLTESAMLSLTGGLVGLALAHTVLRALRTLGPLDLPRHSEIGVDGRVLAFTLAVSLGAGLLFGLAPAMQGTIGDPIQTMRDGGRTTTTGPSRRRLRGGLALAQVALSLVLLVTAGLLLRSYARLTAVDPGFRAERVLTFRLDLPRSRYPRREDVLAFHAALRERLAAIPGAAAVGSVSALPFTGDQWCNEVPIEGRAAGTHADDPCAGVRIIDGEYFRVMGMPLRAGRMLGERDDARSPAAAVINERMAALFWPGESPIGRRFVFEDVPRQVVGVVSDIRHAGFDSDPAPEFYMPQSQYPQRYATIVVRTRGEPMALVGSARAAVRELDPALALAAPRTLDDVVSDSVLMPRVRTTVIGVFAALAAALAVLGIYGVIAFGVSQRTHEIGVRMALGADGRDIVRQVIGGGVRITLVGIALGLIASLALTRLVSSYLFGVRARDPLVFSAAALLLGGAALVGCWIPARRAARVDPLVAIRAD